MRRCTSGIAMINRFFDETATVDVPVENADESVQALGSFELATRATRSQFFSLDVEDFDGTFIFASTHDLGVNSLETLDGLPVTSP